LGETRDRILSANIVTPALFAHGLAGEGIHLLLKDRLRNLPQSDAVILIDTTGRVVNSSRSWPVPKVPVEDRDYFQYACGQADSGTFVSEPVRSPATGRLNAYLVRRVDNSQGEFLGLLASGIEVRYLEDLYRAISLQEGGSVTMLRRDDTILARYPDTGAAIGGKVAATSLWHDHVAAGGGAFMPKNMAATPTWDSTSMRLKSPSHCRGGGADSRPAAVTGTKVDRQYLRALNPTLSVG
jgi:hypothetical protein